MHTAPRDFPADASALFADFADAFEQGESVEPSLSAVMRSLSRATVDGVSSLHGGIQFYCRLWKPVPAQNLPATGDGTRPRYGEMIVKAPDLKYLFLFHQDCYARQAALDAIASPPPNPFFFSAILPRLNDWVPEVRSAALACLKRILPLSDQDAVFVLIRSMFYQWRNWARWTDESSILLETLQRPDMVQRLLQWLKTAQGGRLADFVRTVLQRPVIDTHLYDLVIEAKSPSVRGQALHVLLSGHIRWLECPARTSRWSSPPQPVIKTRTISAPRPSMQELVDLGLSDKSAKVRKIVGYNVVALANELPDLDRVIDKLLIDPAAALRSRGDFLARTRRQAGDAHQE